MAISIARCETDDSVFSTSGLKALRDVQDIINAADRLAIVTATIPIFDIFLDPAKPHEKILGASSYDWEGFARIMKSIPEIKRTQIEKIADNQYYFTNGKEQQFWRCLSDAVR